MGGTSFKLDWDGLDKRVGVAASRISQSQAVMEVIGEMLRSSTVERFDASEGPDGTPWKPSKRALKEGGKTLVKTGGSGLMGSIDYEASPDHVVVGSNKVYARIHQLGGKTGRGHAVDMPARPYLGISEEDIDEARAILADHLVGMLGGGK